MTTEWRDYLNRQGNLQRLSTRRLNILDKLTDSRLVRSLLRARGSAPAFWWRAAQRQWLAYDLDTYGNKEIFADDEFAQRQHRNTERPKRVAAKQSATLRKYRQFSLQSFLELADPMSWPALPLVMTAMPEGF